MSFNDLIELKIRGISGKDNFISESVHIKKGSRFPIEAMEFLFNEMT